MNKQHRILGIRHTLLAGTFLIWLMIFIIQKPLFLAYNHDLYVGIGFKDILSIMSYGLFHDVSVAAYLTVIPGLLILCTFFTSHKVICWFMRAYFILIALTVSAVFVVHTSLYAYWRFPLDATPLFYFLSSPADAFASITPMQILLSVAAWLLFASLILASFLPIIVRPLDNRLSNASAKQPIGFIILLAALFLPMRGSLTVAPVNTGKVFFSQEMAYNHAAVNPIFSVMESLSRTQNFAEQYRFMDDATAHRHFRSLTDASLRDNNTVSTFADSLFRNRRPDILLVILESFSSHLFPSLGGEKIAIKLDAFVPEGILFTRFYANSFRTDRGLLAILSGYPAQPTMSLMKYPSKTAKLPSLAMSLKRAGYGTAYYYGGDADFTNMRSYLYASGMDKIIEDVDFPIEERLSKWGVHDHLVFERLLKDMKEENPSRPMFRIIQTSSSHEPFEVPYHAYSDERVNAFAYTDSVVASALQRLRNTPRWKNLLVVIVADHQGCYPTNLSNYSPPTLPHTITDGGRCGQESRQNQHHRLTARPCSHPAGTAPPSTQGIQVQQKHARPPFSPLCFFHRSGCLRFPYRQHRRCLRQPFRKNHLSSRPVKHPQSPDQGAGLPAVCLRRYSQPIICPTFFYTHSCNS